LNSAVDGGAWPASRPIRFTPGDEPWYALNTGLHWPRAGLGVLKQRSSASGPTEVP